MGARDCCYVSQMFSSACVRAAEGGRGEEVVTAPSRGEKGMGVATGLRRARVANSERGSDGRAGSSSRVGTRGPFGHSTTQRQMSGSQQQQQA